MFIKIRKQAALYLTAAALLVIVTFFYLLIENRTLARQPKRRYRYQKYYGSENTGPSSVDFPSGKYSSNAEIRVSKPTCLLPKLEPDPSWIPENFEALPCHQDHEKDPVKLRVLSGDRLEIRIAANWTDSLSCTFTNFEMFTDYDVLLAETSIPLEIRNSTEVFMPCPSDVFRFKCVDTRNTTNQTISVIDSIRRCIIRKEDLLLQDEAISSDSLNILVIGLDSLSHIGWLEQLPMTLQFVKEELEGVFFDGYNVVGDGTTANTLALLTGFNEAELPESRRGVKNASFVDDYPFIWKPLKKNRKYITLWDEDMPTIGAIHYRLKGFRNPPVDFYGRKFQLPLDDAEESCIGEMSTFKEMIQLYRQLSTIYPDPLLKFAFIFSTYYTHRSPSRQLGYKLDEELVAELRWLARNGRLERTALVLLSDHGPRFGDQRATYRGKIQERLPFLSISLPKWYRKQFPDKWANLQASSKRLTTPFDMHATFLDIAGLDSSIFELAHGKSFFGVLSTNRSCDEAGVAPHWCTCLDSKNSLDLQLNDTLVTASLIEFERYVNDDLLRDLIKNGQCHKLEAIKPFEARKLALRREVSTFTGTDAHGRTPSFNDTRAPVRDRLFIIQLSFWTEPGAGQWEATFQWDEADNSSSILPGQISRTNRYGDGPRCIQDRFPNLRQFCFCVGA